MLFSKTAATGYFGDTHYENCSKLGRRPVQVELRLASLPCLPGSRRGCGGRWSDFGSLSGFLCFVHTASEVVANSYGTDHSTNKDQ